MQVSVMDQTQNYPNTFESIEAVVQQINALVKDGELFLSHIQVDEIDVYDDIPEYLQDRLENIQSVKVILVTKAEFLQDVLASVSSYLERALPEIEALAQSFYQDQNSDAWNTFTQMMDGLLWIRQSIDSILALDATLLASSGSFSLADQVLVDLQEAVEHKDAVAIGDLLHFELLPQLTTLRDELQHSLKVVDKYVN